MMDTPKATEFMESRYIRQSDPKTDTLVFPLHPAWWSRPYEYEWARRFARPDDVVLDAACGISHPFKFWLAEHCREVHACDWDERILSEEAIRLDIVSDFGEQAAQDLPESTLVRLHRAQANLAQLPYESGKFDRVFCISVLEHLDTGTMLRAFREFARVLKPNGQLIATFDVPEMRPDLLETIMAVTGLTIEDKLNVNEPDDAIWSDMYGTPIRCFRAVICKG
ncbi:MULTISPECIES: class I SAM-dependent methyltransferase [Paenibacillus]|uniref:Ubiquinone/menaquinone biosynthesis C-methylase UbiE n=1 Tax=Paenibacillus xylanexedens TaxID=528191 RepID=A0ABS4RZT2_PAEXY|nr:class I SAM-dependent methyltransferase [Paenibacillus xylanexedens]MBP2248405.1 ubiquinone/menaquinone biosynthesis C-methylase UbiE [Paenibacillus xylanexedens]MCP1423605.1 ubiquinone/menaquinone biosynthesis C-methylase UbiE [Paenibacillus xylanexedens]